MSDVARRTVRHAYDDFALGEVASPAARSRSRLARLRGRRWLAGVYGRSRAAHWLTVSLIVLLALLIVRPVVMSALSYHRTAELLHERRAEVRELRDRNDRLKRQVRYYRTEAFIAERAREYGLVNPGETPFVIRELVHPDTAARSMKERARTTGPGNSQLEPMPDERIGLG